MLSIEFNIKNMTETIFYFNEKLFEQPICRCFNECINDERIDDLKSKITSAINTLYPEKEEESVSDLNQILNDELGLPLDTKGISILSLPREPEYRYQDYDTYVAFTKTTSEYATRINADPLFKVPVFLFYVFGEDVVTGFNRGHQFDNIFYSHGDGFELPRAVTPLELTRIDFMMKYGASVSKYCVDYIEDLAVATLLFVIQNHLHLNRCGNCNLFFIPRSRSDEIYCNNTAPQTINEATQLSCKEYGTAHLWYDRLGNDTALKLCRNVYTAKQMLVRRNPDITAYADNFEQFKRQSLEWKKQYKAGKCTADEFIAWLDEQKARKT